VSEQSDIQALERAIKADAREEAEHILDTAQARIDDIRQRAEKQAEAKCEVILQRARQEAEVLRSQAAAAAQLDAQRLRLERRERLLEHVFAEARRQLASVLKWPDYEQIARQLVREGVERLGADAVLVRADDETRQVLNDNVLADLEEELGVGLQAGEPLAHGVGVVLETPDGHRRYDNTLQTRLTRMQDRLRASVYRILMGEAP